MPVRTPSPRTLAMLGGGLALCLASAPALPQGTGAAPAQQKVTGPLARYWLSAETASGLAMAAMQGGGAGAAGAGGGGMGGMSAMMSAMMGGGGPSKTLRLELGSVRDANPAEATHAIPSGLGMGSSLPLVGPQRGATAPAEPTERDVPEPPSGEQPKGRMLFFWGCGESAGPGQPVVLDFAKLSQGMLPPDMRSISLRALRGGPAPGRDRGYADWPNRKDGTPVPVRASLAGEHRVQGNFVPEIRFAVGAGHDYMEPLALRQARSPGGGQQLQWNRVPTALGYFATGMGYKQGPGDANDMVIWNSSSVRLLGGDPLLGFLPPAETERLVREKVVLPREATDCVVPKEVLAAAGGELAMVNLNAFGPELNVVFPPRPEDPKVTWEQQYAVKLRLRSYTGSIAGMDGARDTRGAGPDATEPAPAETPSKAPSATDQVKGVIRGILGR